MAESENDREHFEEWKHSIQDERNNILSLISNDSLRNQVSQELDLHDEIVYRLVDQLIDNPDTPCPWNAATEIGHYRITTGQVKPSDDAEIRQWAVEVWERIGEKCKVNLYDKEAAPLLKDWTREARELWHDLGGVGLASPANSTPGGDASATLKETATVTEAPSASGRPGYDEVRALVEAYEQYSTEEFSQLNRSEIADRFVRPFFEALGWKVQRANGAEIQLDYRDLSLPLIVVNQASDLSALPDEHRQIFEQATGVHYGILTNFAVMTLWDLDRSNPLLHVTPRDYLNREHGNAGILAAENFYREWQDPSSSLLSAQQPREVVEVAATALADSPHKEDLLDFEDYAAAIADFIRNKDTQTPLTISIDAPWGMGKTTLMRQIEEKLPAAPGTDQKGRSSNGQEGERIPTVWFDAWKYDQEESLWAALSLEILKQCRAKLGWWQRLELSGSLTIKRFDRERLSLIALKLIGIWMLAILVSTIAVGFASLFGNNSLYEAWLSVWEDSGWLALLSLVAPLATSGKKILDKITSTTDLRVSEYMRNPNYQERVGFWGEFQDDFKNVIETVKDKYGDPIVIFIDDLDRCAPPKPTEIIEALNLLLDAEHCVFVIGMDSRAVAASIEVKYNDMLDHLQNPSDTASLGLGQHFLEKIVQLNFRIPAARPETIRNFVFAHLGVSPTASADSDRSEEQATPESTVSAPQAGASATSDDADPAMGAAHENTTEAAELRTRQEVRARAFNSLPAVHNAIDGAIPFLKSNPRQMKRFLNHFRLQALIANRRNLLDEDAIDLDTLAKWVVLTTYWPDILEEIASDPTFLTTLKQFYTLQLEMEETEEPSEQKHQQELESFQSDPRIGRFASADTLRKLLASIDTSHIENLHAYLHLAEITIPASGEHPTGRAQPGA